MLFTPLLQGGVSGDVTRTLVCVNTLAKRRTQPQGLQKIDWSNPITNGLVLCTHAGNNFVEMTTNKPSIITGAISTATPKGKALTAASTTFSIETRINKHYGGAVTWIIGAQLNSTGGGGFSKLVDKCNAADPSSGTEQVLTQNGIGLSRGGTGGTQTVATPLSFPAPYNIYAVSVSAFTATDGAWYINGVPKALANSTVGIGTMYTNSANYVLCNRTSDFLRNVDGKMEFAYRWNRVLSPAEVASISANPYQIFKAVTKPVYVVAKSLTRRSIKLPSRKRITQPQTTPQISAYWKSRGFKWVVNGTEPRELVSGVTLDPTAGATTEVNHSGKALANRSTGVGWTKSITSSPAQAATLVWFGDFYSPTSNNQFLAGILPNLTDTAPYANVSIIRARSGSGAGSIGYFYGQASGGEVLVSSPNVDYNEAKNLGIVVKIKSGSQKLFTNKRGLELQTTAALAGGGLYTATPVLVVGSGHVGRNADASCSLFAVSDKFLTDEECLSLAKNPWQIFKAIDQPLYLTSTPRPRSFVKVKTKPQNTQPQTTPVLRSRYATWEWVYTPSAGTRNLGSKGIDGVLTGSAGYDGSSKAGKAYTLGSTTTSTLRLGDTTCKFTQTKPVSGLIVFRTLTTTGNEQALFIASASGSGLYVKRNGSGAIEIDCATTVLMLAGPGGEVKAGNINTVAFCIEPRVVDGGTGRVAYALNGKLVTGTWTGTPNFTSTSQFGVQINGEAATHQQMLSCATTATISNNELVKLSENPWSIFKGQNAPLFLDKPTGPPPPTTLFAELFSGINTLYTHTISSINILLAGLHSNISNLYDHTVSIWQNSVINYLSNLRTKVVTATTKAIDAISTTRTKVLAASTKALNALSATRTKLFTTGTKSVSVTSASRTKVFTPETKSKTFTTTTRG